MAKVKVSLRTVNKKVVLAAGTRERLVAAPLEVKALVIQADPLNTGNIYLGESDVTATKCVLLEEGRGIEITPEDTFSDEDFVVIDLYDIWIDAETSGDGVYISYIEVEKVSY